MQAADGGHVPAKLPSAEVLLSSPLHWPQQTSNAHCRLFLKVGRYGRFVWAVVMGCTKAFLLWVDPQRLKTQPQRKKSVRKKESKLSRTG